MEFSDPQTIITKYQLPNPKNNFDFVDLTAKQMNISETELSQAFPYRKFFHDVCYLTTLGHAAVANDLIALLKNQLP